MAHFRIAHLSLRSDLNITGGNRLIYLRWRDRSPQEVLAWHHYYNY